MNAPFLDLLGDPLPEPLPEGQQFSQWESLVGHTIRAAIEDPNGREHADFVIVTETNCWLALAAETDGCGDDDTKAVIIGKGYGAPKVLSDYVSATMLSVHNCVSPAEFAALHEIEVQRKAKWDAARAARLRAEADRLAPATAQSSPIGST